MRLYARFLAASFIPFLALPLAAQQPAAAPAPAKPDHVTAIKQSLGASMAALRQYEWIETTVVSIKGEEKSRTQNQCYYGVDGKVRKTPVGPPPADDKKRGLRGKIVENKKEEISDSVKEAVALVKQYVPPDSQLIHAAKAASKLSIVPPDSQGNVQVVIKDYLKVGDSLTLVANATTDRIGSVSVATYTDSAKKAVNLNVAIENSGSRKTGQ